MLLSPIDNLGQFVADEEQQTRDVRVAPYYWGESKRFGSGAMGLEVLVTILLMGTRPDWIRSMRTNIYE